MPIRAAVALAATAVGLILLFSFRTPPASSITAVAPPAASSTSSPTPTPTSSGAPPSGGASPTPTATPTPVANGLKSGSFTGQDAANQYGSVQVQLVISAGRITGVTVVQSSENDPQSATISSRAFPVLRSEVLQSQSAQIDAVSGATYTSQSYAESVQSALDMARG
jgi:uncharacterized protein with FMN-binding domain